MDTRQMHYLVTAVRCGSLTRAASELGISQPALSKSIRSLEDLLGVRLIERGRFGVKASRFGELVVARGQIVAAEIQRVRDEIISLKAAGTVPVTIGCGPSEATRLLPVALTALKVSHPEITVSALYGLNEDLMPRVKNGDIEFALSSVPQTASDPDLKHQTLHTDTAGIVLHPNDVLAQFQELTPSQLTQTKWVLARRRELERRALDEVFLNAGEPAVQADIETSSATLMKTMVMQGGYASFMPRDLAYWEEKAGLLVCRPLVKLRWQRLVGISKRRDATLSHAAQALIKALENSAQTLGSV